MKPNSCGPVLLTCMILASFTPGILPARGVADKDGYLGVGGIQFAVSEEVYKSPAAFREAIRKSLERVEYQALIRDVELDLVVFPEYTSAFLGLSVLDDSERERLAADPAGNRMLIAEAVSQSHQDMMEIWSEISRNKPYSILAGSHLQVDSEGRIHNRALLFQSGVLTWTQDKVFPGGPEKTILALRTGEIGDARPFIVDGFSVVTTICRDTYNEEWETALPDADLWIDIKANEIPYTQDYYDQALSARLPDSPIDRGLTVSLSGELLGFRFTGPTEYLYDIGPIAGTDPWAENAMLVVRLPERN